MSMTKNSSLECILESLIHNRDVHSFSHRSYPSLKEELASIIKKQMGLEGSQEIELPGIGNIKLPYFEMGNINSTNLFDLDEILLFYLYKDAARSYRQVIDIGGNIGLHSIVWAKLGANVTCYEPDPIHFAKLVDNLKINNVSSLVSPVQCAISNYSGVGEFTRVLGNTTGSHLSGSKDNCYGNLMKFDVLIRAINDEIKGTDFLKIDAEGEEYKILSAIPYERWDSLDVVGEIGSSKNGLETYNLIKDMDLNVFSQKISWRKANSVNDLPSNYREGSVFISRKYEMPWLK